MLATARNSDCQFCSVRLQKSGSSRYSVQRHRVLQVVHLLLAVRDGAGHRLGEPRQGEDRAHHQAQRPRVEAQSPPAHAGPGGGVGGRELGHLLLLVGLPAGVVQRLGLGRPALQEEHGGHDEEQELQELGLPVLGDVDGERRGGHVLADADRVEAGAALLLVEQGDAGDRLPDERGDEERAEEQGQAVPPEVGAQRGHRCSTPSAKQYASPSRTPPRHVQKSARIVRPLRGRSRRAGPGAGRTRPR